MIILLLSFLLTTIDPPQARWIDDHRAVISWTQQEMTDLTCLSKLDPFDRRVYLGCEAGTSGAHQRILGNPGGDVAWLPETGDRYWVDYIKDDRWTGRSELVTLDDRPVMLWLPWVSR